MLTGKSMGSKLSRWCSAISGTLLSRIASMLGQMLAESAEKGERATQDHGGANVASVSSASTPLPTLSHIGVTLSQWTGSTRFRGAACDAAVLTLAHPR
jgi:hypothetical protein